MNIKTPPFFYSTLLSCMLAWMAWPAFADDAGPPPQKTLVIFGDSLSDSGNRTAASGSLSQPPYDMLNPFGVPADPYDIDGTYYSNGPVWAMRVAEALESFGAQLPTSGTWPHAANYAWGGARAFEPLIDNGAMHLSDQVNAYLADQNHAIAGTTLHAVFIGGNDTVDALVQVANGIRFHDVIARLEAVLANIRHNVNRLSEAGANRFLILNVPDTGLIPAVTSPGGKWLLSCFAQLLNKGVSADGCPVVELDDSLSGIAADLRAQGRQVTEVDTFALIGALADHPEPFGFGNTLEMCVTPLVPPFQCDDPNAYIFWDGIHPTKAVHRLLADLVLSRLGH